MWRFAGGGRRWCFFLRNMALVPDAFPGGGHMYGSCFVNLLLFWFGCTHTHTHQTTTTRQRRSEPAKQPNNQPTRQPANMLGLFLCRDNATKVDDTAHLLLFCWGEALRPCFCLLNPWISYVVYCTSIEHIYIRCQGSREVLGVILWTPLMWRFAGGRRIGVFFRNMALVPDACPGGRPVWLLFCQPFVSLVRLNAHTHTHQTTTTKTAKKRTSQASKQPTNQATS